MRKLFLLILLSVLVSCGTSSTVTQPNNSNTPPKVDMDEIAKFFNKVNDAGVVEAPTISNVDRLLVPNTKEVNFQDVDIAFFHTLVTYLTINSSYVNQDISLKFNAPKQHLILVVNRQTDIPTVLLTTPERTQVTNQGTYLSVINLAGPQKELGPEFTRDWLYAQVMCLSYTPNVSNLDAQCNIFSASAAAGWAKIPQDKAESWINSLGMTNLRDTSMKYRFLQDVYASFSHS